MRTGRALVNLGTGLSSGSKTCKITPKNTLSTQYQHAFMVCEPYS